MNLFDVLALCRPAGCGLDNGLVNLRLSWIRQDEDKGHVHASAEVGLHLQSGASEHPHQWLPGCSLLLSVVGVFGRVDAGWHFEGIAMWRKKLQAAGSRGHHRDGQLRVHDWQVISYAHIWEQRQKNSLMSHRSGRTWAHNVQLQLTAYIRVHNRHCSSSQPPFLSLHSAPTSCF